MTETPTRDDDEGDDEDEEARPIAPRETPPDWLEAQRKAIGTARPKPNPAVYKRRWQR